jgi:hypothetical protein
MAKYLYCIIRDGNETVDLAGLCGLDDCEISLICHDGLACVVSDMDVLEKSVDKSALLSHQRLLEQMMEMTTIIPIAFGHIVQTEEELITKLLQEKKTIMEDLLIELEGKVEIGLKLYWKDLQKIFHEISEKNEEIRRMKLRGKVGRNDQIRAGEIAARDLEAMKTNMEKDVLDFLKDHVLDRKQCNLFGDQMITNVALLVNRKHLEDIDKKVNKYFEKLDDNNVIVKYVGPVPPFNFVDLKINLNN